METAALVLLIIVSSILAVFLILLSVALIFFIRFLRKADSVADNFGSAATAFRRSVTAIPIIKLVANIVSKTRRR